MCLVMHGFLAALFPVAVLLFFDALIPLLRAEPSCLARCAGRLCRLLLCVHLLVALHSVRVVLGLRAPNVGVRK